jgi:hypothetical protein
MGEWFKRRMTMPFLSDLFRTRPGAVEPNDVSTFTPACHDCQKYRVLIQKAMDNCNTAFADTLREDFKRHIAKEHNHARHNF